MSQGVRKGGVGVPLSDQSDRRPLEMAGRAIGKIDYRELARRLFA